jgi:hypothetical protein
MLCAMSDDTPTQRFPNQGDDATERINTAIAQDDLQEEKQKSRGLLVGLIIAGALLLAAIIVLVFVLGQNANNGGGNDALPTTPPTTSDPTIAPTDEASATPDPTPSATETDSPDDNGDGDSGDGQSDPPPATGAAFTKFDPKGQVECDKGGPNFSPPPPPIKISWATVRTTSAWIVGGTSDAADSHFMQIPLHGNQGDFQYELDFPCFQKSTKFTITLVGTDGKHVSKTWKVTNVGDHD